MGPGSSCRGRRLPGRRGSRPGPLPWGTRRADGSRRSRSRPVRAPHRLRPYEGNPINNQFPETHSSVRC